MVFHDDEVCQVVGLDLRGNPVDRFHRIAELQIRDSGRGHQGRNFLRDSTDHCYPHAVHVHHLVLRQDRGAGALLVDVRAQVGELRVGTSSCDAVAQVRPTAVELVVAYSGSLQFERVQDVDGGLVLRHRRSEEGSTDVVTGRNEGRSAGSSCSAELFHRSGEQDGV
ncbi:hypothetical protein D3C73_1237790 [compost metagenome]